MIRKMVGTLGFALLVLGVVTATAGEQLKVKGMRQDLSDMRDGETRTFGEGKSQVTATRKGDDIEITFPDGDGDRTLHCKHGEGNCFVMTHGDGEEGMIVVKHLSAGAGEAFVWAGDGDAAPGEIKIIAEVDDQGGEPKVVVVRPDGAQGNWEVVANGEDGDGKVRFLRMELHGSLLSCPEGDTTMHVDDDDTTTYLCPKHNVALEKAKGHQTFERKVKVSTEPKSEE